jgi:hypothetical protein
VMAGAIRMAPLLCRAERIGEKYVASILKHYTSASCGTLLP